METITKRYHFEDIRRKGHTLEIYRGIRPKIAAKAAEIGIKRLRPGVIRNCQIQKDEITITYDAGKLTDEVKVDIEGSVLGTMKLAAKTSDILPAVNSPADLDNLALCRRGEFPITSSRQ